MTADDDARVLQRMQAWLNHAVIGLNLCPFAKAVQSRGQLRWALSDTADEDTLLADLQRELQHLVDTPAEQVDTTVLVHPQVLQDFGDYNEFLGRADELLQAMGLEGVLQIASFHPHYQFAGTDADDVSNATNRAPYPCLHLLREDSLDRAAAAFPEAERIYEANIRRLQALGAAGWAALSRQWAG